MDDFVSFPDQFDLSPFLAPNRDDYKLHQTSSGPRAAYMDWPHPDKGPEAMPVMYKLYAVVIHLGTMVGGHYIAYCLVDPEKMFGPKVADPAETFASLSLDDSPNADKEDKRVWCFCSDTTIRLASLEEVLQSRAYLCFYEKVHPATSPVVPKSKI